MIHIFNGSGASKSGPKLLKVAFEKAGFETKFINHNDIRQGIEQSECSLICFGGQSVGGFKEGLGEKGIKNIISYVHNGGHFLGVCAGAYFAMDHIRFTGQTYLQQIYKKRDTGLGLIPGTAYGSLQLHRGRYFSGFTDSLSIIPIYPADQKDQSFYNAAYWGGPTLNVDTNNPNIEVLATTIGPSPRNKEFTVAAKANVGDKGGTATAVSFHFEIDHINVEEWVLKCERINSETQRIADEIRQASPPLKEAMPAVLKWLPL